MDSTRRVTSPFTDEFGAFVRQKLDRWKIPGMSLAVIDGDAIFTEGYGFATVPDVKATPDTLWDTGSTTKAQVAATLAHLIDSREHPELAGGWATKVASVIRDDFVLEDEWATNHVTLDDAVSHRTGMPAHDLSCARVVDGRQQTPRDFVRNMRNLPLVMEPRVTFRYCNLMYVTLGHVIETITGKALGTVLRSVIWDPLGMKSTYLGLEDAKAAPEHLATGYYWDDKAQEYRDVAPMGQTESTGAGGVISTVVDYAQWVKCLLDEAAPFSPNAHKDIRKPRMLESTAPSEGFDFLLYGLGWGRVLYKGHIMYTHNGGTLAFGAKVCWLPEVKFGAVAFANTAVSSNAIQDVVIYRLIDDKLGIPESERFDYEKKWQDTVDDTSEELENADKILFPDMPDPPLPSTFTTGDLVGTYSDPGYGDMTLREEAHPDKPGEKILVADRDNMTWRYQLRMHHVSGDYWTVRGTVPGNSTLFDNFQPGEFRKGIDGNVSVLEIQWLSRGSRQYEGKTLFRKMS